MAGVKGRSGRHRSLGTIKRDIETKLDSIVVDAYDVLANAVAKGDINAAIYAINRRQGTPKQSIDQRTRLELSLSADDFARNRLVAQQRETKLLEAGDIDNADGEFTLSNPYDGEDKSGLDGK